MMSGHYPAQKRVEILLTYTLMSIGAPQQHQPPSGPLDLKHETDPRILFFSKYFPNGPLQISSVVGY